MIIKLENYLVIVYLSNTRHIVCIPQNNNVVFIDCAGDPEIAQQLESYLKNLGFTTKIEESLVIVNEANVEHILKDFLKETNRLQYSIRKIDSTSFLLSKEIPIEDFGFLRCEMCGYVVSSEEELLVHRRAHGIQLL